MPSEDPWARIAVVGCTGSGKSSLARKLSRQLQIEHVELDAVSFAQDWQLRPREEFRADVARLVAGDRWVIDGNYHQVRDLIWPRATAVVWLDRSLGCCLWRTFGRTVRRCWTGERVCGDNYESWRQGFFSTDSVLLWVLRIHAERRRELERDFASSAYAHLRFERIRSNRESERFLAALPRHARD